MSSKIEQAIDEIEEFIDGCRTQKFSSGNIIVNRDQMDELLQDLRENIPEEVKRYQKIISNQEAIIANAQTKADQIISQAQIQTNELVSEHQIMQQAYAQANEIVMIATKQAQDILDHATNEANSIRVSAMDYTDGQLGGIETILTSTIEASKNNHNQLITTLQQYLEVVTANRAQLLPLDEPTPVSAGTSLPQEEKKDEEQPEITASTDSPDSSLPQ